MGIASGFWCSNCQRPFIFHITLVVTLIVPDGPCDGSHTGTLTQKLHPQPLRPNGAVLNPGASWV